MERRVADRIMIGFKATLSSGDITFEGVIDDLSEKGVKVLTYSSKSPIIFAPETLITLNFQPSSSETLNLDCRVKWTGKLRPHGSESKIGMEIINSPWEESRLFV
jgi:hypothetical protein